MFINRGDKLDAYPFSTGRRVRPSMLSDEQLAEVRRISGEDARRMLSPTPEQRERAMAVLRAHRERRAAESYWDRRGGFDEW